MFSVKFFTYLNIKNQMDADKMQHLTMWTASGGWYRYCPTGLAELSWWRQQERRLRDVRLPL